MIAMPPPCARRDEQLAVEEGAEPTGPGTNELSYGKTGAFASRPAGPVDRGERGGVRRYSFRVPSPAARDRSSRPDRTASISAATAPFGADPGSRPVISCVSCEEGR